MKVNRLLPQDNKGAAPLAIRYGFCTTPFGEGLAAWCEKGVCYFGFAFEGHEAALADLVRRWWDGAEFSEDAPGAQALAERIFDPAQHDGLTLLLKGTPFQIAVWDALLKIPFGQTTTYAQIAATAGRPRAVRAAASAVGDNPVAFAVPCHRVMRTDGSPGGYFWGLDCKRAILRWEAARK